MVVGLRGGDCAATGTPGRGSYSVIGCDDDVLVIGWITTKFRTTAFHSPRVKLESTDLLEGLLPTVSNEEEETVVSGRRRHRLL